MEREKKRERFQVLKLNVFVFRKYHIGFFFCLKFWKLYDDHLEKCLETLFQFGLVFTLSIKREMSWNLQVCVFCFTQRKACIIRPAAMALENVWNNWLVQDRKRLLLVNTNNNNNTSNNHLNLSRPVIQQKFLFVTQSSCSFPGSIFLTLQ